MKLSKEILDNGIVVYRKRIYEAKTILLSINVKIGSLYEEKDKRGISHFLEHMMFKSNKKYTSKEISMGLELNGGISNAFTSTFLTSYFVEVLPIGFQKIVDILFSMFENDKYNEKEFELEKKVILSEIERYENDPEDLLFRLIPQSLFGRSDYGDPISGYRETVNSISKNELEEFKAKYYSSSNIFILIEGNFGEKHLKILREKFSELEESKIRKKKPIKKSGNDIIKKSETRNQIYFSKNYEIELNEKDFYLPFAFGEIISGGISSLMFNIFREKYGIGYKILFEPIHFFHDRLIISLAIPGYEKDKDKFIEIAQQDLIEEINNKKFENYFIGRKKVIRLNYEKSKTNLFKRNRFDPFLIFWKEETIDEFYKKILKIPKEDIVEFSNSLIFSKKYKIVKLVP